MKVLEELLVAQIQHSSVVLVWEFDVLVYLLMLISHILVLSII